MTDSMCADCGKPLAEVPLNNGQVAIIHAEDLALVTWRASGKKYSWSALWPSDGTPGHVKSQWTQNGKHVNGPYMHTVIMGTPLVDHRNRDGLDNRKDCNLREATKAQNLMNQGPRGGASQYKGVAYHAKTGKWRARIKQQALGLHATEEAAARAYDAAAREQFGEFARLNFPEPGEVGIFD